MDELKGPNIQIVLHVKEGLGFGFLKSPFVVTGSLNGYMLETDPVVPTHSPCFDAELIWEADKRRFRSLRVQNVPVKVEVYTVGTQGRKDKIGYLLLSLLGAQPCPANKYIDIKNTWHKLLGVRPEGKCCHPQLLLSLSIEDRTSTPTPRNELRMFHSNEVAFPANYINNPPPSKSMLLTLNEYLAESKKTVLSADLKPVLICEEGLIQIGNGSQLFVLSFVVGSVENLDLLLPEGSSSKDAAACFVTYSVFTHDIMTDRVNAVSSDTGIRVMFNQRSTLRLRSELGALGRYFRECPHLVTTIAVRDRRVGICSLKLQKLVPSENLEEFLKFCNYENSLTINERCFILRCDGNTKEDGRRAYVDVEMSLKYLGASKDTPKTSNLTARSATELKTGRREEIERGKTLECKSESCTVLDDVTVGVAYTNITSTNTARYKDASGDKMLNTNEIADLIKKMCDTFAESQEKLLASRLKPPTSDMMVQCEHVAEKETCVEKDNKGNRDRVEEKSGEADDSDRKPIKLDGSHSDTFIQHRYGGRPNVTFFSEMVKSAIPPQDRDSIMKKFVEELEDWKEKQQELFKHQLKCKEEYHLELLSREWNKKRGELEGKLRGGVEQCRTLAADLARATNDFRLRGYRNSEREKQLSDAKKALESHYTAKYQELREASQKMEDDMNHRIKLKDMRIEELEIKVMQLEKQIDTLKNNLKNTEKEADNRYSGLTKDQTASLIQELRCLEEKLDSAVQSKAFFKEQWGRAVRELHLIKLNTRKQMLTQLKQDRKQLGDMGLGTIEDEEIIERPSEVDMKKLKDDFYVDLLANTPALQANSIIGSTGPDAMDMFESVKKNPANDKLNNLIAQRDSLIQTDSPDEDQIKQLNQEIRSMLLNCGT